MRRIGLLALLLLLATCGTGLSQILQRPQPVRLRIEVTYEDGQTKVRDATVELMDAVGGSSAANRLNTDTDGRVEFTTTTGGHRVRISGAEIQPLEARFEIAPVETYHIEHLRVRRKVEAQATPAAGGTVPTTRLKVPEKARKEFEKGSEALQKQQWQNSRTHFQAAIDAYPDYDLAYNGIGVATSNLNETAAARKAFTKAIELNPNLAEAQRNLARIYLAEHNYPEAQSLLKHSLESEPSNVWALTNVAYAELQIHHFQDALVDARKVHTLPHQGMASAHMIAGYALEALNRPQEAAAEFRLCLTEEPSGPNAKRAREAADRLAKAEK